MATNMLGTLLEAALFLEEVDKLSSQSEFSSSPNTTTTSSTASSPSTSSPTNLLLLQHRPSARQSASSPPTTTAPSWAVKMCSGSPTIVMQVPAAGGGLSPHTPVQSNGRGQRVSVEVTGSSNSSSSNIGHVVSTNQSQYPTAKAVSLSVANLPQQTAAIPLIIGQQQQQQQQQQPPQPTSSNMGGGASLSISAATKYGYHHYQQQQQHLPTTSLLNSINQAAVLSGNGFPLTGPTSSSSSSSSGSSGVQTITGGITRIVDSSGNILHLPSGTAAAAVNSNGATTYSTLVRVNGNTEEQFDSDALPPSLVVISPQNFAGHQQQQQHHHNHHSQSASHHGQTISIIPGPTPPPPLSSTSVQSTGLDLSHVDFVQSTGSGSALSSNQQSTNTLEVTATTTTATTGNGGKTILLNQPFFVSRPPPIGGAYPGMLDQQPPKSEGGDSESIMKSTNMVFGGKMQQQQQQQLQQPLLANGLLGPVHFQHSIAAAADKPEDLSSHLTFTATANGYGLSSSSSLGVESVNNILSKTTGTTTTLVGAAPKPVLNLRDLSIDPQQLQQQQSIYDIVYQKGVMTTPGGASSAGTATATGRRRTISNNSTGGSQRSPSSMRSGTRESHNKLEKNRRAQMKNCFEQLKKELPKGQEEKKTSNLSILSNALNYITTLKRTEKEWEHELGRLVKVKIDLQRKLESLKREMASQLDKDPALAALVAGDLQRSVRTSESGADEASSMDGYPSNSDETDSFRGVGVERSMSPTRNMSPLVISGPINNGSRVQMLGDQVSVEVKHRTSGNGLTGELLSSAPAPATILAVPNLSQVNHLTATSAATPLPLTAINLSSTANPNNHVPHGVLNIPTPSSQQQQIFTSATTSFVTSNGQSHVIMKGGHGSGGLSNNTSISSNGFNKGNGLIIKEALPGGGAGKAMKFGHSGADAADQPPTKMVKLVNGSTTTNDLVASQAIMHPHTQVLPIYSSTQNGGLRVIGHHTTTTTSTGGGHHNNGSMPTSVVFSDPTTKYHQHLSSGMVISAPLGGTLPTNLSHQYLTSASSTGAAQVHKLLLTGMGPNMMAQGIPSGYSLPHMAPMNDMFPRSGSTSLPGGAQLNLCRSTPSPTISISAAAPKGNGPQKGAGGGITGRAGTQITSVPLTNGTLGLSTANGKVVPQIVTKEPQTWNANSASPHSFVPFQVIATPTLPVVSALATGGNGGKSIQVEAKAPTAKGKRASNGGARGAKRKNAAAQVMITPQTSMEPVKGGQLLPVVSSSSSNSGGNVATITNAKPTTIK